MWRRLRVVLVSLLLVGSTGGALAVESRTVCEQTVTAANFPGPLPYWLDGTAEIYGVESGSYVYLGLLNSNQFMSNSVLNEFGSYGSKYSSTSIFNTYSTWGSPYSSASACNHFAGDLSVPSVFWRGQFIGNLTTNSYSPNALSTPLVIAALLAQNAATPVPMATLNVSSGVLSQNPPPRPKHFQDRQFTNIGSVAISISSSVVSGDFAGTTTCGSSLAAGAILLLLIELHAYGERPANWHLDGHDERLQLPSTKPLFRGSVGSPLRDADLNGDGKARSALGQQWQRSSRNLVDERRVNACLSFSAFGPRVEDRRHTRLERRRQYGSAVAQRFNRTNSRLDHERSNGDELGQPDHGPELEVFRQHPTSMETGTPISCGRTLPRVRPLRG